MQADTVPSDLVDAALATARIPELLEGAGIRDALAVALPLYAEMIAQHVQAAPPTPGTDSCNCPCSRARTTYLAGLIRKFTEQ